MHDGSRHAEVDGIGCQIFSPRNSGVVYENIEVREPRRYLCCKVIDGLRIFHVEHETMDAGICCRYLVEEMLPPPGNDNLIASAMKFFRKGTPDPTRCGGNENCVVGEFHEFSFFRVSHKSRKLSSQNVVCAKAEW